LAKKESGSKARTGDEHLASLFQPLFCKNKRYQSQAKNEPVPRPYSDAYLHVRLLFAKSSGVGVLIPKKGTANKGGLRTADKSREMKPCRWLVEHMPAAQEKISIWQGARLVLITSSTARWSRRNKNRSSSPLKYK